VRKESVGEVSILYFYHQLCVA